MNAFTETLYEALSKSMKATYIGFPSKSDPKTYIPLKIIKAGENVTGYPSTTCKIVNTAQEVEEFDRSNLDLEAYAIWAEDLLKGWKASADFPELGMKKVDDTVREEPKSSRRVSRKDLALEILESAYDLVYSKLSLEE